MFDEKKMREIGEGRKRWEDGIVAKTIARFPERKEEFKTLSGYPVDRTYTPEHIADLDYERDLGFPGEFPFTRGAQATMYRGRLWTMRQYAGFGSAEESNRRYKYLLEQGQTGLSVAFDLPTQIGYDSDNSIAAGEVGKVGVAIDSVRDVATLFDGIPLDEVSTSMTINAPASILLAMYIAVGEMGGNSPDVLSGTIQNDILKEYVARGTYIFPPEPSMRLITDIFEYCSEKMPNFNTISVSGYHMREAGCTAAQEVGFTLANAIAYVDAAVEAGLEVDAFAPRVSFFFAAQSDLLEEVAKFRAARRLWARIMRERYGGSDRSARLRFHTQTAGCTLTAQQPDNNIVRVAMQALAAVLGGTQSLHTNSRDEALALPTEESVRIALRTQQILAHESGVADTVDPLAGSFYVERLTDEIEEAAREYIREIDDRGGAPAAIEEGYVQREIQESAYRHQRAVESEERVVVGVNRYRTEEKPRWDILRVDPAIEERQLEKLEELRCGRDSGRVDAALEELTTRAASDGNLMPPILEAVRAEATLGEITDALRSVFGEYRAPIIL
ncbi:MAG: methylmalonyl-CoA mutase [Clostridia bacterium]